MKRRFPSGVSLRSALLFVLVVVSYTATISGQAGSPVAQRGSGAQARARLSTPSLAKKASVSMVTVTTASGLGSGVIVDAAGVFVTNLHVIRGETAVSVKLANGDVYDDVSVVDVDERKDLVI